MKFDDIVKEVGGFGRYQKLLILLVMFPQILISIQAMLPVFILSKHDHRCQAKVNDGVQQHVNITSYMEAKYVHDVTPYVTLNTSQCSMEVFYNRTNITEKEVCTSWSFDTSELTSSPISDFGLVCDDAVLTQHASMVFMGAFETVDADHRSHATVAVKLAWCLGEVILSGVAYFLRDWRQLELVVSSPGVILLFYWLFMPESARWLLSKGKGEEAMKIVRRAARVNRKRTEIDMTKVKLEDHKSRSEIMPVFKSYRLLLRFIVILILWFILTLSYYGLTFSLGRIGHNVYLNFLIYAVLEMVAYVSSLFINTRFGRKPLNIGGFLFAGTACVSSTLISMYADEDNGWLIIGLSAIGRMGISAVLANIFVYTSELFPTTIRSFILAVSDVATRIGAIIAPYISALGTNSEVSSTSLTFGVLSLVAGVLSCFLPETLNTKLPDSMSDMGDQFATLQNKPTRQNVVAPDTIVTYL
ncbi:organic cation transporter protein-like [Pecten maximus]|uniref:organic cation transporter protein-like n=1 Tax=Pecten maximus TaxID=6579 RepID=UPI001457F6EA|nr:organic cation transporter protein-like [Pecten maximus]